MKTEVKHVFVRAYGIGHISHTLVEPGMVEHYENDDSYLYLCEVVIPVVDEDDIRRLLLGDVENEIAIKSAEIAKLKDKKQQLLAISHKG